MPDSSETTAFDPSEYEELCLANKADLKQVHPQMHAWVDQQDSAFHTIYNHSDTGTSSLVHRLSVASRRCHFIGGKTEPSHVRILKMQAAIAWYVFGILYNKDEESWFVPARGASWQPQTIERRSDNFLSNTGMKKISTCDMALLACCFLLPLPVWEIVYYRGGYDHDDFFRHMTFTTGWVFWSDFDLLKDAELEKRKIWFEYAGPDQDGVRGEDDQGLGGLEIDDFIDEHYQEIDADKNFFLFAEMEKVNGIENHPYWTIILEKRSDDKIRLIQSRENDEPIPVRSKNAIWADPNFTGKVTYIFILIDKKNVQPGEIGEPDELLGFLRQELKWENQDPRPLGDGKLAELRKRLFGTFKKHWQCYEATFKIAETHDLDAPD